MARNKAGDVTSKEPFHSSPNQESSNLSSFLPFQGEKVHCLSCSVSELRDVHIINIIIYTKKKTFYVENKSTTSNINHKRLSCVRVNVVPVDFKRVCLQNMTTIRLNTSAQLTKIPTSTIYQKSWPSMKILLA